MKMRKTLFPAVSLHLLYRNIGIQDWTPGPAVWTKFFLRHELLWSKVLRKTRPNRHNEPNQPERIYTIDNKPYIFERTIFISPRYLEVDPGQNLLPRWHSHSCWFYASLLPLWFVSFLTILLLMLCNLRVSILESFESYFWTLRSKIGLILKRSARSVEAITHSKVNLIPIFKYCSFALILWYILPCFTRTSLTVKNRKIIFFYTYRWNPEKRYTWLWEYFFLIVHIQLKTIIS